MSLYDAVQTQSNHISTKWLKHKAIDFSHIVNVREMWSGLIDERHIRGFYIEGPLGPPVVLRENEALITLARSMCTDHDGKQWRRFIFTKELMHVFDEESEKTDTRNKFDQQINKFSDPNVQVSPQWRAEAKAFWRALAVLSTERERDEYKGQLLRGEVSLDVVSVALRIPLYAAIHLFSDDFDKNLPHLK